LPVSLIEEGRNHLAKVHRQSKRMKEKRPTVSAYRRHGKKDDLEARRSIDNYAKAPGPPRDAPKRPLPAFFYKLPVHSQRCYLRSDAIAKLEGFAPDAPARSRLADLQHALEMGTLRQVQDCAFALTSELCRLFRVPSIRVEVRGVRPHNARGELHGLFRLSNPPEIVLWMRTAQRHEVVKPRTFLRTLLHELCHYLDYSMLKLEDSFHTMGFFKRESFLVRSLIGSERKVKT
jgi:hypothetical protein